jgi:hypothetical protein
MGSNISYGTSSTSSPFYNKTALATVTISNNVTALGTYIFNGCTALNMGSIIDASIDTVGDYAFKRILPLIFHVI